MISLMRYRFVPLRYQYGIILAILFPASSAHVTNLAGQVTVNRFYDTYNHLEKKFVCFKALENGLIIGSENEVPGLPYTRADPEIRGHNS